MTRDVTTTTTSPDTPPGESRPDQARRAAPTLRGRHAKERPSLADRARAAVRRPGGRRVQPAPAPIKVSGIGILAALMTTRDGGR